jgi:hypothetical protein
MAMMTLPITSRSTRVLKVKNTFLVEEDEDGEARQNMTSHVKGARTCIARLSGEVFSERFCNETSAIESGTSSHSLEGTTPTDDGSILSDGETWVASDDDTFTRTPTGSESNFDCPHTMSAESVQTRVDRVAEIADASSKPSTISLVAALPQTSMRQVMLQVPVDLPPDIDCEDMNFAVSNMRVDAKPNGAQVALRLIVGGLPAPPQAPCRSAPSTGVAHVVEHTARCSTGAERADLRKQASLSPSWQPPQPTATCCHWKNKGWCKFRESCKFAHPPHKRGIGSTKLPFPPLIPSIQLGGYHV